MIIGNQTYKIFFNKFLNKKVIKNLRQSVKLLEKIPQIWVNRFIRIYKNLQKF